MRTDGDILFGEAFPRSLRLKRDVELVPLSISSSSGLRVEQRRILPAYHSRGSFNHSSTGSTDVLASTGTTAARSSGVQAPMSAVSAKPLEVKYMEVILDAVSDQTISDSSGLPPQVPHRPEQPSPA